MSTGCINTAPQVSLHKPPFIGGLGEPCPMQQPKTPSEKDNINTRRISDFVAKVTAILSPLRPLQRDAVLRACLSVNVPAMKWSNLEPKPFYEPYSIRY